MRHSKRYEQLRQKVDRNRLYSLDEAVRLVKENANAKFDESVEVSVKLGIDPKKQDQMVSGTVSLPHGTGKKVRVLAFVKGDKVDEAQAAGADYVGFEDLVEKISSGWTDFDVAVATPDTMAGVGRLGKILGPKGLMPSPKSQTVTFDIGAAIKALKAGRISYRTDKTGNVHAAVGKVSFDEKKLIENIRSFMAELIRSKPASAKGQFIRKVVLSSTMGVGVRVDPKEFTDSVRREV
ncbi:MAG: 50S ribosomal protein L1 [candidate division WOR-3 bacterium]|jgi:large subunit ribosomal protein L1|nr:50S ribosomal protein L1 [candidate division WOR-3 bacterium]MCR4423789.1 50S ribosomal protein L1 [candidate division WOR-3 bacterium]MDH7519128.1 50S ribosomal protein L1 [bacterium]